MHYYNTNSPFSVGDWQLVEFLSVHSLDGLAACALNTAADRVLREERGQGKFPPGWFRLWLQVTHLLHPSVTSKLGSTERKKDADITCTLHVHHALKVPAVIILTANLGEDIPLPAQANLPQFSKGRAT